MANFKFFRDLVTNPDNKSYSAKRVAGWMCMFVTLSYVICSLFLSYKAKVPDHDIFFSLCGLTAAMWGLTSYDNKVAKDSGDTDGKNP